MIMMAKWYSGTLGGLKLPDICLIGEEKPRKNLTQETCPDRGSNMGPLRDKRACYHLLHSGGLLYFSLISLLRNNVSKSVYINLRQSVFVVVLLSSWIFIALFFFRISRRWQLSLCYIRSSSIKGERRFGIKRSISQWKLFAVNARRSHYEDS